MLEVQLGRSPVGRRAAPAEVGVLLTPPTAVGDALGNGVSVPALRMGERFVLATQILGLTGW